MVEILGIMGIVMMLLGGFGDGGVWITLEWPIWLLLLLLQLLLCCFLDAVIIVRLCGLVTDVRHALHACGCVDATYNILWFTRCEVLHISQATN